MSSVVRLVAVTAVRNDPWYAITVFGPMLPNQT